MAELCGRDRYPKRWIEFLNHCPSLYLDDVESLPWFYKGLSRDDAVKKLNECPVGYYLLRSSETQAGSYTLAFKDVDRIKNHMISKVLGQPSRNRNKPPWEFLIIPSWNEVIGLSRAGRIEQVWPVSVGCRKLWCKGRRDCWIITGNSGNGKLREGELP